MGREADWRNEITGLSSEDMDDELQRPTGDWQKDVTREALRRILSSLNTGGKSNE